MRAHAFLIFLALAAIGLTTPGCSVFEGYGKYQERVREERATAKLQEEARIAHDAFRAESGWKKKTYHNKEVLALATADNVSLEVGLDQQRGLLLVKGAIAMDFPIASGKSSHPTPKGSYNIRAKVKDYHSNLYGKIVAEDGTVVVEDADTRRDVVPEGAAFSGAAMPYWMRLTDSGVGLHVGYVPGRPASHGCVRLKRDTAKELFAVVKIGTPVVISGKPPALGLE